MHLPPPSTHPPTIKACVEALGNPPMEGPSLNTHPLRQHRQRLLARPPPPAARHPSTAPLLAAAAAPALPPPPPATPAKGRGHLRGCSGVLRRAAAWRGGGQRRGEAACSCTGTRRGNGVHRWCAGCTQTAQKGCGVWGRGCGGACGQQGGAGRWRRHPPGKFRESAEVRCAA